MYRHNLTASRVRELLDYDPSTGELTWRATKSGRRRTVAGTLKEWGRNGKKRRIITIDYLGYQANRIIWLWVTGSWPKYQIDHINRDAMDDRWENLRDVPHIVNARNRSLSKNNTSGTTGVCWDKGNNRWKVMFSHKHYGYFKNKKKARQCALGVRAAQIIES